MDKELLEFEAELRRFRPRAAPVRLLAGIERELAVSASSPRSHYKSATCWTSWKWGNWSAAAALAAVTIVAGRFWPNDVPLVPAPDTVRRGTAATTFDGYKPVSAERTVFDTDDEGFVTLGDGRLARRVRSRYVDTITWRNAQTNASLRWSVPREEVRVVPVNAY